MHLLSWLRWYKKPEYRDIKEYSTAVSSGRRSLSPDGRKTSIPSQLALDRILQNKTCSPMSLYDFYMYLKHIEFSEENLEFYIWFKNFEATWAKIASTESFSVGEKDDASFESAPESTTSSTGKLHNLPSTIDVSGFSCDAGTAENTLGRISQLIASDSMCSGNKCSPSFANRVKSFVGNTESPSKPSQTYGTLMNSGSGLRAELDTVIKTFLLPGSEKELNIPPAMRERALYNLQTSSDPAHFQPIANHVYQLLRNCSHRNFVRLGVSNGTFETLCVATTLGIVLTIAGFMCVLLRACTPHIGAHSRWEAFAPWPMWWLGLSLILSGLRGSCFFLLLFTRRQPLPWERFDDSGSVRSERKGLLRLLSRLMIFDRKLTVKDANLRRLQHKIVIQSLIGGSIFASAGVLLFIFLPVWRETVKH
ncbi:hypothetical protein QBC33DRAFT_577743 [Phialemonium atrogriseum]|uniref:RGS domain-containing protein n=1 Tax=Phialemonium atrogriseum TaxID=1093897 RepID=A0AAJ0C1A6_9PEZI|nr:uncharacterized protein QBC33DRAFT_577743 [Phialemonium atrogriseum]KAK1768076.1 hypothetical protein QBC33DRAFT_577743 [Phialemonium atrogriseum]